MIFIIVGILLILVSRTTALKDWFTVDRIQQLVQELGVWGPLFLTGVALLTPLLMIPRWPVAVACGALYGLFWGSLFANIICVGGALIHYGFARLFLARSAERLQNSRLSWLKPTSENEFITFFLLRAFPLSNSSAVNLLAGSMRVSVGIYVSASFLGMLPSTIMYASWGKLLKKPDPVFYGIALGMALLLTVSGWFAHRHLKPYIKNMSSSNPTPPDEKG